MKRFLICCVAIILLSIISMTQSRRTGQDPTRKPSIVYGSPSTANAPCQEGVPSKRPKETIVKVTDFAESPTFSPDGTKIAFIGKGGTIWIKDIGRKTLREVSSQHRAAQPSWSPDGKMIAFARYGGIGEELSIWIIDADGKNARQLVEPVPRGGDQWPCWSPDGKSIVLSHGYQLWIVNSNGSNARALTLKPAKAYEYCGQWSATSALLAYLARDDIDDNAPGGRNRIWLIGPVGQGQTMVSHDISASRVKWSKDAKSLYYMSREGCSYTGPVPNRITKIDLNGGRPAQKLTELPYTTENFDISPDGRWIVYDDLPEDESPTESPTIYMKRLPRGQSRRTLYKHRTRGRK
jgi:Tol biopolymer transport system component